MPFRIALPIPHITPREGQAVVMNRIKTKKVPGFDLINSRVLKESTTKMPTRYYTNIQSSTETWLFSMSMDSCTGHNAA